MGSGESKEEQIQNELKELQSKLLAYCGTEPLRIVLCGAVKAGKSSLVNTILSAFKGKVVQIANPGDSNEHATAKYLEYKIKIPDKTVDKTCIVVCDTRGVDKASPEKQEEALKAALAGSYASNQYMDKTGTGESSVSQVRKKKKAVYIIFVIDSTEAKKANMSGAAHNKEKQQRKDESHEGKHETPTLMQTIRTFANGEAIPFSIILTKCDKLDGEVAEDIERLDKSDKVQLAINYISQLTGLPKIRIFPVVNYTDQHEATPPMRLQIFNAFRRILTDIETSMSVVVRDCE